MSNPTPPAAARRLPASAFIGATASVVLLLLVPIQPAAAIIGGTADGTRHPYVGTLDASYFGRPDGPTGVLISPTVLLTVGHVTTNWEHAGLRARVTFDPARSSATVWHTGTAYTSPAYDPQRADASNDLGVVVFDSPVTDRAPAALPAANLLETLGVRNLRDASFELVGYGTSLVVGGPNGGGQPHPDRSTGGTRKVAIQTFMSMTSSWLRLQQHEDGSACVGDSGSPSLFAGTNLIAAIHVGGVGQCRNTAWEQRIDTPSARAFLSRFVQLP